MSAYARLDKLDELNGYLFVEAEVLDQTIDLGPETAALGGLQQQFEQYIKLNKDCERGGAR